MDKYEESATSVRTRINRLQEAAAQIESFIRRCDGDQVTAMLPDLRALVTSTRGLNVNRASLSHLLVVCANVLKGAVDGLADRERPMTPGEFARTRARLRKELNAVYSEVLTHTATETRRAGAVKAPVVEEPSEEAMAAKVRIILHDFKDLDNIGPLIRQEAEQENLIKPSEERENGQMSDAVTYIQNYAEAHKKARAPSAERGYSPARLPIMFETEYGIQPKWFARMGGMDKFTGLRETGARLLGNVCVLENQQCIIVHPDWDPATVLDTVKNNLPKGVFDVLDGDTITSSKLRARVIWLMRRDTYAKIGPFVLTYRQMAFDAVGGELTRLADKPTKLTPAMREWKINDIIRRLRENPYIAHKWQKNELRREIEKELRGAASTIVDRDAARDDGRDHQTTLRQHREAIEKMAQEQTVDLRSRLEKTVNLLTSAENDLKDAKDAVSDLEAEIKDAESAFASLTNALTRKEARKAIDGLKTRLLAAKARAEEQATETSAIRSRKKAIEAAIESKTKRIRDAYRKNLNKIEPPKAPAA